MPAIFLARHVFALLCVATLIGCSTTPSKVTQVRHDPTLARESGVLLLVDTAVQIDVLGQKDYFVLKEADEGGKAALAALKKYLRESNIPIRAEVATVAAARLTTNGAPISVAPSENGPIAPATQPLRITSMSGPSLDDPETAQALGAVSTYAFERAGLPKPKKDAPQELPKRVSIEEFKAASSVLKAKTGAGSILFLGVLGKSISGGKATAQFVGRMLVGVGTAFATAGLGTGFYLVFVPGGSFSGMMLEGALIDLDSGELTWSNAVRSVGDPVKPKNVADPVALDLLFHGIVFKPVTN